MFDKNSGIFDDDVQEFVQGRNWVFLKDDGVLHSMSATGIIYCGIDYDKYRDARFLEDYEMCEKCVSGYPPCMQDLMTKKVSGLREWAMKNDKDLDPKIFDMKPNQWSEKIVEQITKETISDQR